MIFIRFFTTMNSNYEQVEVPMEVPNPEVEDENSEIDDILDSDGDEIFVNIKTFDVEKALSDQVFTKRIMEAYRNQLKSRKVPILLDQWRNVIVDVVISSVMAKYSEKYDSLFYFFVFWVFFKCTF